VDRDDHFVRCAHLGHASRLPHGYGALVSVSVLRVLGSG
jgi:hypothetical protein